MIALFFQRHLLTILGWLATAGAVLAVLFGARNAGRKAEQVEQMKHALKGVGDANKIRNKVAADANAGIVDKRVQKFYKTGHVLPDSAANPKQR